MAKSRKETSANTTSNASQDAAMETPVPQVTSALGGAKSTRIARLSVVLGTSVPLPTSVNLVSNQRMTTVT
eukprot:CAMPEP_0170552864 /NCGR_PEP_ID=MMETSP0211-20121228/10763_1 /TAXON_ID=311385 /ORGANISM="Pseudokeronopsis sp., Strain OXSARD2" /LENGTH=70 /DNA_ID=CAMNT_0010860897 /DNA_START=236 /DNA_END=448 /DNA_ORIENTATION=-